MDDRVDRAAHGGLVTPRWVTILVVAVLVAHAFVAKMPHGLLIEMLWACHVATSLMGLGILLQKKELVIFGFSFHLGAGMWGYFFDILATRATTWTSVLVHALPLAIGFFEVRRSGLPRWAPWISFAFLISMMFVALYLTPPDLNINLAHRAWAPAERLTGALWVTWLVNIGFAGFLIFSSDWLVRKWLVRYTPQAS
jgi:uncharacterized membrane protein